MILIKEKIESPGNILIPYCSPISACKKRDRCYCAWCAITINESSSRFSMLETTILYKNDKYRISFDEDNSEDIFVSIWNKINENMDKIHIISLNKFGQFNSQKELLDFIIVQAIRVIKLKNFS